MPEIIQRIAMKAAIVKDGKVLVLREAATYGEGTQLGRYHMPGGRLEIGENFEQGLKREVMEETGLEVEIVDPLYVGEWRPIIKNVQNQIVAVFFVCKPTSGDVRLSTEHDDYRWIKPEEYAQYDIMEPEDKVIDKLIEQLRKPHN